MAVGDVGVLESHVGDALQLVFQRGKRINQGKTSYFHCFFSFENKVLIFFCLTGGLGWEGTYRRVFARTIITPYVDLSKLKIQLPAQRSSHSRPNTLSKRSASKSGLPVVTSSSFSKTTYGTRMERTSRKCGSPALTAAQSSSR